MQDVRQVEENLAVIRRLMERGTRYEAITGRGALVAGAAALAVAGFLHFGPLTGDASFLATWAALAVAAASWVALPALRASHAAAPEGSSVSAQARAVALEVVPAYLAAAVLTAVLWRGGRADLLPCAWMLLHGVAILATASHAPSRLVRLGIAFVAAGAVAGLLSVDRDLAMAAGFGGLNIVYGAISLAARREDD